MTYCVISARMLVYILYSNKEKNMRVVVNQVQGTSQGETLENGLVVGETYEVVSQDGSWVTLDNGTCVNLDDGQVSVA